MFNAAKKFTFDLWNHRRLIWELAIRDFKTQYLGNALGITWAIVEPAIYMGIMWFFFNKALKFRPSGDQPYMAWLMSSMILWNFFSAGFASSSSVFRSYSYLMKRWNFNMAILPLVKILSIGYVHLIFIGILTVLFLITGIEPNLYWLQIPYYFVGISVLLIGLTWVTASVSLFIRDIQNIVSVLIQFGFWVSPIFWDINTYPEQYRDFMKFNPLYYPMEGYRGSLLYQRPIWEDPSGALYFWTFSFIILGIGYFTYKKLRPHFGDVI